MKEFFLLNNITNLVCSAACGADLLALNIARPLNISRKIILPFTPSVFKVKSVEHCIGDWKCYFDALLTETGSNTEVVVLNYEYNDLQAFQKTNIEILKTADELAYLLNEKIMAIVPEKFAGITKTKLSMLT